MTRRLVQGAALALFIGLLVFGVGGNAGADGADLLLRLDPSVALVSMLADRAFLLEVLPALALIVLTPLLGRLFCGWICPLGTTIDGLDAALGTRRERPLPGWLRRMPFVVLLVLAGAALAGANLVHLAAPIPLATRIYGYVILPAVMHGAEGVLMLVRPLALDAGWNQLAFAEPPLRAYPTWTVALGFVALLVAFARLAPRFWCRYCCPAGALFALASRRSLLRRRVGEECVECGKCAKACPSGAAADSPATDPSLCLLCMSCRKACPARTVDFGFDTSRTPAAPPAPGAVGLSGRRTAMATIAGFGLGAAFLPTQGVGRTSVLRPPGALPEEDFLARCVRCGECAALCPTGTIRPLWFASGAIGLFSPAIDPVAAPCDPRCTTCGEACPTRALLPLDRTARPLARPGVAVVIRKTCLAWEDKKKCLVCDEVCPFDAVVLKDEPGNPIQVPHVVAERCAGCGYCEYHCPARPDAMELLSTGEERAIVVRPEGALRLENADYVAEAKRRGLDIRLRQEPGQGPPPGAFPDDPGYDGAEEDETPAEETLPPGFILD